MDLAKFENGLPMIDACSADEHQRRRADIAEILISQMAATNSDDNSQNKTGGKQSEVQNSGSNC